MHVGDSFRFYKTGVFEDYDCPTEPNHAVTTVGWGVDKDTGKEYIIIRNSWGPTWGEEGYIRVGITENNLGICGIFYRQTM